jgi:hypothetical protein
MAVGRDLPGQGSNLGPSKMGVPVEMQRLTSIVAIFLGPDETCVASTLNSTMKLPAFHLLVSEHRGLLSARVVDQQLRRRERGESEGKNGSELHGEYVFERRW